MSGRVDLLETACTKPLKWHRIIGETPVAGFGNAKPDAI
jgi:hypothetical protein